MKKSAVLAASAALALVPCSSALAGPSATYQPPVVSKVNPVVVADASGALTAAVVATYTCHGGSPNHLYIGVKQGELIDATEHTSSQYADSFFSTNWNSDGPGLSLSCDGKQHTQRFVLKPDPYWAKASTAAPLHAGRVFVQFCVFDSTNSGEGDMDGFAFDYSMKKVVLGD